MAKQCAICGKKRKVVWKRKKLRGKYNPTTKRIQKPNLQWVRVPVTNRNEKGAASGAPRGLASGKRILACAKCIKALSKRK